MHRGGDSGSSLWWTRFDGTNGHRDTKLTNHFSAQGAAIINFRDRNAIGEQLFCVHRGNWPSRHTPHGRRKVAAGVAAATRKEEQPRRERAVPYSATACSLPTSE